MQTPVLSESQRKKSLSAKKKRKETIRNVLASPYDDYWPLITPDDSNALSGVLANNLLKIRPEKINVPYKDLKNIPREKRKQFRLDYNKIKPENIDPSAKIGIVFGVNEVTKLLESRNVGSILITSDVNPRIMVKHIIDMAVLNSKPVLMVPNLKETLKEHCGLSSLAVAFQFNLKVNSRYWIIDQKIKEIYCNYPVPENHIHFNRKLELEDNLSTTIDSKIESESDKTNSDEEKVPVKNIHLYRDSLKQRVFLPELSNNPKLSVSQTMECTSGEFLTFTDDKSIEISPISIKSIKHKLKNSSAQKHSGNMSQSPYKSLIVKRIRNNNSRSKKKIEMLKQKK